MDPISDTRLCSTERSIKQDTHAALTRALGRIRIQHFKQVFLWIYFPLARVLTALSKSFKQD